MVREYHPSMSKIYVPEEGDSVKGKGKPKKDEKMPMKGGKMKKMC